MSPPRSASTASSDRRGSMRPTAVPLDFLRRWRDCDAPKYGCQRCTPEAHDDERAAWRSSSYPNQAGLPTTGRAPTGRASRGHGKRLSRTQRRGTEHLGAGTCGSLAVEEPELHVEAVEPLVVVDT